MMPDELIALFVALVAATSFVHGMVVYAFESTLNGLVSMARSIEDASLLSHRSGGSPSTHRSGTHRSNSSYRSGSSQLPSPGKAHRLSTPSMRIVLAVKKHSRGLLPLRLLLAIQRCVGRHVDAAVERIEAEEARLSLIHI